MNFTVTDARNAFDFLSAQIAGSDPEAAITFTRLALYFADLGIAQIEAMAAEDDDNAAEAALALYECEGTDWEYEIERSRRYNN